MLLCDNLSFLGLETGKLAGSGFQNVKNQIGFCGIWCGSCSAGNGAMIELTKKYDDLVDKYRLEKWVPKDFDFKEFKKGLGSIQTMSLCPGCQKNGGPPACKIRTCAVKKGIVNCSQCETLTECSNFQDIEKSHPKIRQGLKEMKNASQNELINKWTDELKTKWPHCVVLCEFSKK
jgi:hypothetical protein